MAKERLTCDVHLQEKIPTMSGPFPFGRVTQTSGEDKSATLVDNRASPQAPVGPYAPEIGVGVEGIFASSGTSSSESRRERDGGLTRLSSQNATGATSTEPRKRGKVIIANLIGPDAKRR